ncbi:OmpH family outer membrane protein [Flavobacterium sp.]|uniref:OmpH family outer membrane protein n=1 Tax=Flavobacterium sp. TaxID=239 RepID=UPI004047FB00
MNFSRRKGFEQEVAIFQQTGGNMTQNQVRAKQDELMQKEQNLVAYRNNLMQELSTDESKLLNDVYEQVQVFMKEYAKENGIDIVLSHTRGGAMWYAKDGIDVTKSVVEGLNKKYSANPAAAAPAKADSTAKK